MNTRLSKAALFFFALSSIIKGYEEASTSLNDTAKCQCVSENSCLNGGTRNSLPNGRYECHCMSGFTGIICETEYQCVRENSCLNGGIRKNLPNGRYECHCLSGFTGIICETAFTGCRNYTDWDYIDTYNGNQSWTFTNKPCQRWDSQTPHNHTHTDASMFHAKITNISHANNYCRNPDDKTGGPWCLTTDPNKRWEYCNIPFCHNDCRYTDTGADYAGKHSLPGCLRWEDVKHSYTPANFPGGIRTLSEAHKYCRNPNNDTKGLWCYTNHTRGHEYCDVHFCQGCLDNDYHMYDGRKSTTESGLTCQRWDSQSPHPHNVTDPMLFKFSSSYNLTHVNEAENYCQIVDGINRTRPWCYTTVPFKQWEYCDVPVCE